MSSTTADGHFGSGERRLGGAAVRQGAQAIGKRLAGRAILAPLGPIGWAIGGALLAYDAYELYKLYNESHEETSEDGSTDCVGDCNGTKDERQGRRRKELEEEAGVEQATKGKTKHGEKEGGMDAADRDFESLEPDNVREIDTRYGKGRVGTLENDTSVVVRPGSSDGRPTLELRNPRNGRGTEIRYNFTGV